MTVRDARPRTPSPRRGEGRDEGVTMVQYRTAGAPSSRPSPPWGEGVRGTSSLTADAAIPSQVPTPTLSQTAARGKMLGASPLSAGVPFHYVIGGAIGSA